MHIMHTWAGMGVEYQVIECCEKRQKVEVFHEGRIDNHIHVRKQKN